MVKWPRLTPEEAERLLLQAGFEWVRTKGSHKIYQREDQRMVLPFHRGQTLHPKIIKALMQAIGE